MLIVCPNCATSYHVRPEYLGGGRSVRCVTCHHVWFEVMASPAPQFAGFSASPAAPGTDTGVPIQPQLDDMGDGRPIYSQENSGEAVGPGAPNPEDFAAGEENSRTDAGPVDLDLAPPIVPGTAEQPHCDTWQDIENAARIWTRIEPKSESKRELKSERESQPDTVVGRTGAQRAIPRKRPARRRSRFASGAMPALILVLILMLGGLVTMRQQVVRHAPQTASLYALLGLPVNLRGLQFDGLKTVRETKEGVPVLVVEGEIVGTRARLTEVPRLRFAVLDRNGREIYAWTARPERTLLPPGETLPFRSRLASPPAEASSISVRFFDRRDAIAGVL